MGIIKEQWESFERSVVPRNAPDTQRIETRRAFYAGAATLFHAILNILEPGAEATDADLSTMTSIDQELKDYLVELRREADAAPAPQATAPVIGGKEFSKGIPEADYYEARPEGLDVFSWSPDPPGTLDAKPAHVHLHILLAFGRVLVRFKGPGTLDRLIDALAAHREDVWGKR